MLTAQVSSDHVRLRFTKFSELRRVGSLQEHSKYLLLRCLWLLWQAQKQNKVAQIAVAGLAAAILSISGNAIAAEGAPGQGPMKSKICASNPTAKICLKDSVPRTQSTSGLN